ncbi:hypothetical protein Tco_0903360 [Tanacetum coccineum]
MAEPIFDDIEKAQTKPNLSITSNDIEIELNEKFLVELQKNIYQGTYNEDVVEHIAKVLKLVDLIYVPSVDSHQLRMKVFPFSLADDAKEWWINMWTTILQAIMNGRNLKMKNRSNTAIDSFFKAYDVRNIEKENEQGQTKRKDNNNDDKQPNKRRYKAEKFEAIQY